MGEKTAKKEEILKRVQDDNESMEIPDQVQDDNEAEEILKVRRRTPVVQDDSCA